MKQIFTAEYYIKYRQSFMLIDMKLNILSIYIFNILNTWILNLSTFDILDTFDMLI